MSLNDSTLEGDYYNIHGVKLGDEKKNVTTDDKYNLFAAKIAESLFNKKPPIHRRLYESLRNSIRSATPYPFRKRR